MPTDLVPKPTASTRGKALEALSELVDLLCPNHPHELSITNPMPTESIEGYSVIVECCEEDIVWAVQMWENCSFRRIRRSMRVTVRSFGTGTAPKTFLRTLKVWEGLVCDDIVKLHRLGRLEREWWNYPVILSDEHKDAIDYYNQEPTNDDPENEIRAIEAGYQGPGAHNVARYPTSPEDSSGLSTALDTSSLDEDTEGEALSEEGTEYGD
ncbi:unnamed protein product [Tuber aestivum]|uniref:Uncharacterized protein n=1 Tax=Tuber aestivum TaxID=59557 RepID=A0A292Q758_9PEZI|nr:unnamed protein product [Tuber aestivum]